MLVSDISDRPPPSHSARRVRNGRSEPSGVRVTAPALVALVALVAFAVLTPLSAARAQAGNPTPEPARATTAGKYAADIDSLVARALSVSPKVRAAAARVDAAGHRIAPAGARPDPMLMAGIQNFPITEPGFADFMTMKMVGVSQVIPFPGKLSSRTRAAEQDRVAAQAQLDATRLEVEESVRRPYYDLAYLDRALAIVERNQSLLVDFMKVTEARYIVGKAAQEDVLRTRVQSARLGEEAVALIEDRRGALAALNAVLDRPSDTPVTDPHVPRRIAEAAVAHSADDIRFVSATLGARVAGSPLPPLDALQEMAIRESPVLRAYEATIAAHIARAELARKERLPDFDISLSYGQRDGYADMVTATVSLPIALQRRRNQDQLAASARSEVAALESERHERINAIRADVARLHADLERHRAQLALYVKAILPQGRAALTAATAGYQVGRSTFVSLLNAQETLFSYETTYFRVLSEFAKSLAQLERIVGAEVLP